MGAWILVRTETEDVACLIERHDNGVFPMIYPMNRCTIGMRRPMPKALDVTFSPGAA
jgi:hypothetical protein